MFGPLGFIDALSPFSFGTQSTYAITGDTKITTQTVPQNPATVDVEACTVSGCSFNPPADFFFLFPPGDPKVDSLSPTSGPAPGGTSVTISGQNLGCVTGVFFGSVPAATFSNVQALLDRGLTTQVTVTAPPGTIGTTVPVTVTTVESDLTGAGPSASTATFTYLAVPPAFTAAAPLSTATVGVAYQYQFKASGDPAPTYAVFSGAVPSGLHLGSTTGVLSGSPSKVGIYTFRVTASNGINPPGVTPALSITVVGANAGYRMATATGQVFTFGADASYGSLAGVRLNRPIVGMASTPTGHGYWLVASDGGVFSFGDAGFHGSTAGAALAQPVVGVVATVSGRGYGLVATNGDVANFGDFALYGSIANQHLASPVVGITL